jgi:hypothetical protein
MPEGETRLAGLTGADDLKKALPQSEAGAARIASKDIATSAKAGGMADTLQVDRGIVPVLEKQKVAWEEALQRAQSPSGKSYAKKQLRIIQNQLDNAKAGSMTDDIAQAKASGMSFDDWVKGQGETLYHGTTADRALNIEKTGFNPVESMRGTSMGNVKAKSRVTFLSENYSEAKVFGKNRADYFNSSPEILEVYFSPKKTLDLSKTMPGFIKNNERFRDITPRNAWFLMDIDDFVDDLIKKGYDSVRLKESALGGGKTSLGILDSTKLKTKAQLRAEWDKVGGKTTGIPKELEPLAAEARKYESQYEFVGALRRMDDMSSEIENAIKTVKNNSTKGTTDALEDFYNQANQ